MKAARLILTLFLLVSGAPLRARAQGKVFSLADARAGESYRQSLPRTLREKYDLSVASGSRRTGLQWVVAGRLPSGLSLDQDEGVINGTPDAWQEAPYKLHFKVLDAASPESEPLELSFALKILPPRVQLVKSNSVRLVPASANAPRTRRAGSLRAASVALSADGTRPDATVAAMAADPAEPSAAREEDGKCPKLSIVSINKPKRADLAVEIVVEEPAIKALDIFVRSDQATTPVKRVAVPRDGDEAVTVSEDVKLLHGDNTISVFGLDSKHKTVLSCEKTINFNGTSIPAAEAVGAADAPAPTILTTGPISLAQTKRTVKKSELLKPNPSVPADDANFKVKALLFGEKGDKVKAFYVRVLDGSGNVADEGPKSFDPAAATPMAGGRLASVPIKLGPGHNTVTVLAIGAEKGNDSTALGEDTIDISCEECPPQDVKDGPRLRVDPPFTVSDQPDAPVRITVIQPEADKSLTVEAERQKNAQEVQRQKIREIHYEVSNVEGEVFDHGDVGVEENSKVQPVVVGLREGTNSVKFFGRDSAGQKNTIDTFTRVECRNCVGTSSRVNGSSIYTRAIVGFEQAGGSGSDSTQKPFLDFFFGSPVGRRIHEVTPRVMLWGNARFASLPLKPADSTNTLNGLTSGFLDAVSGLQRNEAIQSFDFQAGIDMRIIPQNDRGYLSLIPGTRQRTSLSFIASFGAISPLSADTTAPRLFAIPKDSSGATDASFAKLFPGSENKDIIAFVVPNRDRFYRQYYAGVRAKTFFYDRHNQVINRFPAMIDFTVGQNEAVTGNLRGPVFRLEGFYPFPFREANFFYLYGTAMMKLGGDDDRNPLPLFLKNAPESASITDTRTLVVPIDTNPNLRRTRDSYRLGVGIDLIELLNKLRAPTPPRP